MFIVWYLRVFSRLPNLHPWYWNSLLYGLIYSGENSGHFLQLIPFIIFPIFVPPGTHHCLVDRGSMIWEACPTPVPRPVHMASSVSRAPVTHPGNNWARRCSISDMTGTDYLWAMCYHAYGTFLHTTGPLLWTKKIKCRSNENHCMMKILSLCS